MEVSVCIILFPLARLAVESFIFPHYNVAVAGLEIKKDFEVSVFDKLSDEQISFLLSFLKNQGNLKSLQTEQGISYPAAKKKLNDLLVAMNLVDNVQPYSVEDIDTSTWKIDPQSSKASDIVKAKLISCNGLATVRTYNGERVCSSHRG